MKILKKEPGKDTNWLSICNMCFKFQEECTCTSEKRSMLGIDPHIIKSLQILHSKGYQTVGCCQGHVLTYETKGGNVYTQLSGFYVTFDIHSFEDMKKEQKKHPELFEGFELRLCRKMEDKRYEITMPNIRKRGDMFDFFVQKRNERISRLENLFSQLEHRKITEDIIITYY